VVNQTEVYVLKNRGLQDVALTKPNVSIAVSNGYHYLAPIPLQLKLHENKGFKIGTYLDNVRLGYILFLTLFLFTIAWLMHSVLLQVLANLPILIVCAYVLWNRKNILYIQPLEHQP
jgi:hypothetical protein